MVKAFNTSYYSSPLGKDEKQIALSILTQRELEVAKLVAGGKNNREICNQLFLTEGTVKNYVTRILEKLSLNSRTELAIFMRQFC